MAVSLEKKERENKKDTHTLGGVREGSRRERVRERERLSGIQQRKS